MNWEYRNEAGFILRIRDIAGQRPYQGKQYKDDKIILIEIESRYGTKLNCAYGEDAPLMMIRAMCDVWVKKDKIENYAKRVERLAEYLFLLAEEKK